MHPGDLSIKDFSYVLPEEKIASFPLENRDQSKLLLFKNGSISEDIYHNITDYLPVGALLVFNNTRVIAARLLFQKPTGGNIEIFALEPHDQYADISTAMQATEKVWWKCLIGGAGKWKHGQIMEKSIVVDGAPITLRAKIIDRSSDSFTIEFTWQPPALTFSEILHRFGAIPIPPYLKRAPALSDEDRYQTIYAKSEGSVAAPTAGLHFTKHIFESLQTKKIPTDFVTLHVGAGTFMPVKAEAISGHKMHAEFIRVERSFIQRLINHRHDIFAVGTTSLRTLESVYWMGVKCALNPAILKDQLEIKQWEVYDELEQRAVSVEVALMALLHWMELNQLNTLIVKTSILIAPPYRAKLTRGIITNFHQPNSTLLLLVAALIGDAWTQVYDYALEHDFRFLSYGDGCLLYIGGST